jgi:hypothetical protein
MASKIMFNQSRLHEGDHLDLSHLAQLVEIHLRAGPYANILGLMRYKPESDARLLGVSKQQMGLAMLELVDAGIVLFDPQENIVLIKNFSETQSGIFNTSGSYLGQVQTILNKHYEHWFTDEWVDEVRTHLTPLKEKAASLRSKMRGDGKLNRNDQAVVSFADFINDDGIFWQKMIEHSENASRYSDLARKIEAYRTQVSPVSEPETFEDEFGEPLATVA